MSEVTDTAAAGEVLIALGQAWTLSHVTPAIRARYSAWLKGRARQEQIELRPYLNDRDYRLGLAVLGEEMAAGAYSWGSPLDPRGMGSAVQASLGQGDGNAYLLQLLLDAKHGEVPPEKVVALIESNPEGVRLAVMACLGLPVPNAKTPENPGSPENLGSQAKD